MGLSGSLGLSGVLWGFLALLWRSLEVFGALWGGGYLMLYEVWGSLGLCGALWGSLGLSQALWGFLGLFVLYGASRLSRAPWVHWDSLEFSGALWALLGSAMLSRGLCGTLWDSMGLSGTRWGSGTLWDSRGLSGALQRSLGDHRTTIPNLPAP